MINLVRITLISAVLLVQSYLELNAQNYLPLLAEEIELNYQTLFCDINDGVTLSFSGDTIFQSLYWKKINAYQCRDTNLYAFARTNTEYSKLWVFYPEEETERLLMDLDLMPGDTFFYDRYGTEEIARVTSVSLIEGRKYVYLDKVKPQCVNSQFDSRFVFIEGFGPAQGIFRDYNMIGQEPFDDFLTCVTSEDSIIYRWSDIVDCNVTCITTSTQLLANERLDLQLVPNPSQEFIYIVDKRINYLPEYWTLKLYDLNGNQIIERNFQNSNVSNFRINISDLQNGVYIIQLQNSKNQIWKEKLFKR